MRKKLKIAVLYGGKSTEHEVSKMTANEVLRNLDRKKYEVLPIYVAKDGISWNINSKSLKSNLNKSVTVSSNFIKDRKLLLKEIDIVFIAMHGRYGEDGTIQGFLELLSIPYTGSNVLASAIGMDKLFSRKLFKEIGLDVPKYVALKKGENTSEVHKKLELPVYIQPNNQGSAIGASLVKKREDLEKAVKKAHTYSNIALVDEYLKGVEVTCAILGNDTLEPLPLIEICPKHDYFDFESKYDPKLCDEVVPASISKNLTSKASKAALKAYKAIGCSVFGRVDMIIVKDKVYVLEVNTIPGLTSVSLFPKAAKAVGITYPQLLDKIISLSLQNVN